MSSTTLATVPVVFVLFILRLSGVAALFAKSAHPRGTQPRVTYQETSICETTPGVKSYSGYVSLPASLDPTAPYENNLFFWFFEARNDPANAPLTLWLQGGPGEASIDQALSGHNGPCVVQPDSNSTALNPWSWTAYSHMLYLDQPAQTGFSYDVATPGVMDMTTGDINPGQSRGGHSNLTMRTGIFGSQDPAQTANTTQNAARTVSNFLQAWFQEFPQYHRPSINIWSQSYGGHYAPAIASVLMQQSKVHKRNCQADSASGQPSGFSVSVDSVGIISPLTDVLTQAPYYPQYAINNSYGIQAYNTTIANQVVQNLYEVGGCRDAAEACLQLLATDDPNGYGNNPTVDQTCAVAFGQCWDNVYSFYDDLSGRDWFDIAHFMPDPFPPPYAWGYLNNAWVQKALGANVNFTQSNNVVAAGFVETGDFIRGFTDDIVALLNSGVRVALIHGDRDYRCNWLGGEAVSLSLNHTSAPAFRSAGYAPLVLPPSPPGASSSAANSGQQAPPPPQPPTPPGYVRQAGPLTFVRVREAGHEVPHYAPAAAQALFARTVRGLDAATGTVSVGAAAAAAGLYRTSGLASVFGVKDAVPPPPVPPVQCYVDAAPLAYRCTAAQVAALLGGTAVVNGDRVVVVPAE